jgi:hypothetical protein
MQLARIPRITVLTESSFATPPDQVGLMITTAMTQPEIVGTLEKTRQRWAHTAK